MASQRNQKATLSEDFYKVLKSAQALSKREQKQLVQQLAGPIGLATLPIGQLASQTVTTVQQVSGNRNVPSMRETKVKQPPPQKKAINQSAEKLRLNAAIKAITDYKARKGLGKDEVLDPSTPEVASLLKEKQEALDAFKALQARDSSGSNSQTKSEI